MKYLGIALFLIFTTVFAGCEECEVVDHTPSGARTPLGQYGGGGNASTLTDVRDGQVYSLVTIGNQTWMAENLRYNTSNSYINLANPPGIGAYGRLYTWNAAYQACPVGWHLPSMSEWTILISAIGGGNEGYKMKSLQGWFNSGNGSNSSGFNAVPAGERSPSGSFLLLGESALFWTSSTYNSSNSLLIELKDNLSSVNTNYYADNLYAFSCRCVMD